MIKIVFIVNGVDVPVKLKETSFVFTGRNQALRLSNNMGRPFDEWEIHNAAGEPLAPKTRVKSLGLVDGDRLFLNLGVGAGG